VILLFHDVFTNETFCNEYMQNYFIQTQLLQFFIMIAIIFFFVMVLLMHFGKNPFDIFKKVFEQDNESIEKKKE